MNINLTNESKVFEVAVMPVFKDTKEVDFKEANVFFSKLKENGKFKGKLYEMYIFNDFKDGNIKKYIFLGLGNSKKLNLDNIRNAMSKLVDNFKEAKDESVYINIIESELISKEDILFAMMEGLLISDYSFDKYKEKKEVNDIEIQIGIGEPINSQYKCLKEEVLNVIRFNSKARDLVNEPANNLTPEILAKEVIDCSKNFGFEAKVMDLKEIQELKMEAFLAVAKGSYNKPKLIVMKYFNDHDNEDEILGMVGKGLTYDSGGYSIKSSDGMITMKSDMGGAAAVIGAMCSIAKQKLKINVVSVIAACENMISGKAYKPGDIIDSMSGKTIEVLNTDAEGRLTLADAVYYTINNENANKIIDIATLTGAALVALGDTATAVLTNNNEFYDVLKRASEITGEKVWQLPSYQEYSELLKSKIADLKNIGGKKAGTITAGLFIKEFIGDIPWLHLDIAGTSWSDSKKECYSVGATGVGSRLLYHLAKNL